MAGLIPPDKLEQIRAASDIVDVIGAAIPLKRAGANFVALCPFHREKSPSFNVNPHRQIFHCFGCHKGGDVFSFVREYENLSFVDAVKRLAERANLPLEFENQPGQRESRAVKDTLLQMHEQIARRWQTALDNDPAGQIARDYLAKRGVAPEAVELFRLGFAPDAWDDTVNWSKSKGYDLALAEQAGLIIRKEGTDRYYDRFRGRLMFPICDEQGRIVAFSGRVLSGDEKTAKYVNSPETPIFTKGKVLYALDKAKRAILDLGFVVVCEGQLDTIACHSHEMRAVVAPQGTALTAAHARILRRFTEDIILCFDGDAAGQRAATRAFDELITSGVSFRVASIPPPDDPDSYIKKFGRDAFAKLIRGADDFFEFYLKYLCSVHDVRTDRGRVNVTQSMKDVLHPTYRDVIVDTYAQKTAQRLGVDPEAVRAEFKKRGRAKPVMARDGSPDQPESTPAEPPPSEREFWLLRFLLLHEEQMDWVAQHLDLGWLEHATLKRILAARLAAHSSQNWRGVPGLIDDLEDAAAGALITEAAAEEHTKGDMGRNIVEAVRLLRNDHFERQLATLKLRLATPSLSEADTVQILREQAELRRARQQPFG
jgi:DNA primase